MKKLFLVLGLIISLITPSLADAQFVRYNGTVTNLSNYQMGSNSPTQWIINPGSQAVIKLDMPVSATSLDFSTNSVIYTPSDDRAYFNVNGVQASIKWSASSSSPIEIIRLEKDAVTENLNIVVYIPSSFKAFSTTKPSITVAYNGSIIATNLTFNWSNSSYNLATVGFPDVNRPTYVTEYGVAPFAQWIVYYTKPGTAYKPYFYVDSDKFVGEYDSYMSASGWTRSHYEFYMAFNGLVTNNINIVTPIDVTSVSGTIPQGTVIMREKSRTSSQNFGFINQDEKGFTIVTFDVDYQKYLDYSVKTPYALFLPISKLKVTSGNQTGITFPTLWRAQYTPPVQFGFWCDYLDGRPSYYCDGVSCTVCQQ